MGNEIGNPSSKMGITSLAMTTPNIEMKEFEKLYELTLTCLQNKENKEELTREDFAGILKQLPKLTPSDSELFLNLFTLFDVTGYEKVDYRQYFSGSAACLTNSEIKDKLTFSFKLYDSNSSGYLQRGDIKHILLAINNTAAYFGDPVLSPKEIETMSLEMFKELPNKGGKGVEHELCKEYLIKNPVILKFIRGEGTVRFGSPDLTL